jgi:hypothetical protein
MTRKGRIRDVWTKSVAKLSCATAPVITNTNMNKMTAKYVREFVHQMSNTPVRGVVLSFYTQIKGHDSALFLSDRERKKTLITIRELQDEYKDFILTSNYMTYLFTPGSGLETWNSPKNCPVARYSRAFTSDGHVHLKCAMGEDSVCERCGCGMAPLFKSLERLDFRTMKWLISVL